MKNVRPSSGDIFEGSPISSSNKNERSVHNFHQEKSNKAENVHNFWNAVESSSTQKLFNPFSLKASLSLKYQLERSCLFVTKINENETCLPVRGYCTLSFTFLSHHFFLTILEKFIPNYIFSDDRNMLRMPYNFQLYSFPLFLFLTKDHFTLSQSKFPYPEGKKKGKKGGRETLFTFLLLCTWLVLL